MRSMFIVLSILAVLSLTFCTPAEKQEPKANEQSNSQNENALIQNQATLDLVSFVTGAAEFLGEKGEDAYPALREKGSEWFTDDLYIFIWGMDGMRYVYPPDPSGEGKNMLDLKDINGKPIGKMFVESAEKGNGWVFYEWPRPETQAPVWKATYIVGATLPDGKKVLVGSGIYDPKPEKAFVKEAVDDAVDLLQKSGENAMEVMRARSNEFIFLDSYVFIKDMQGLELLNPAFPELEGKNVMGLTDPDGRHHVQEEIELLQTRDQIWMEYLWPKPGTKIPVTKIAYLRKTVVNGDTLVVAAGFHPDSAEE